MKTLVLFFCMLMLSSLSIFPQGTTVNSRLIPSIDEQNLTYSVLVQINLNSPDELGLKQSHLCYTINEDALEFINGEILTFIEPNYENYEIHDRHEGHYHSQTKLINGETPIEVGQGWIDYAVFNFAILDVDSYPNFCPIHIHFKGLDNDEWNEGTWFCDITPLPVELTLFTTTIKLNNVILNWRTETEINNLGFEIERKVPSSSSQNGIDSGWVKIGFVPGHGTTTDPQEYFFLDDISMISSTTLSYRLKQVDFDGSYDYSDVVLVENISPGDFELKQNYPNPFNPSTTIKYTVGGQQFVVLKVYDVLGEEVATLVNEEKSTGTYEIMFDATVLTSGVYFYTLEAGSYIQTRKMILLR